MKSKLQKLNPYLPYFILSLCAIVLIIKAQYSFCWSDETFYFSTTNRFYQGDAFFKDEWFPTQLVSLLLLPFYRFFLLINGSSDGVLLFFRACFVLFSYLMAILTYRIIGKQYSRFVSLCAGLLVMFYAHLNIATLSYYTLSVDFYLLSMLLIFLSLGNYTEHVRRYFILAGVSFAASVICLPTMAVAYFVCAAALVLVSIQKKELRPIFPYTLIGIVILAIPVVICILARTGISGILDNLTFVLSDEEHTTSLIFPFKKFFLSIYEVYHKSTYFGYLLILFTLVFGRRLTPSLKRWIAFADFLIFLVYFFFSIGHTGYIFTAMVFFALPLYFMTKKRNHKLFFLLFASGMVFSMVFSYSSNGYLYIMTLGHSIAAIGAICFTSDFIDELSADDSLSRILYYLCISTIAVTILQTATLRMINIYRDAPLPALVEEITDGPAKGLYTTHEHAEKYRELLNTIRKYDRGTGNVFFTKLLPWGYLVTDMKCGAPTTWRTTFNSKRLDLYYEANPDRIPELIFVVDPSTGAYDTCGDVEADPAPNENEMGGWLMEYVTEENYEKIKDGSVTIYQRSSNSVTD